MRRWKLTRDAETRTLHRFFMQFLASIPVLHNNINIEVFQLISYLGNCKTTSAWNRGLVPKPICSEFAFSARKLLVMATLVAAITLFAPIQIQICPQPPHKGVGGRRPVEIGEVFLFSAVYVCESKRRWYMKGPSSVGRLVPINNQGKERHPPKREGREIRSLFFPRPRNGRQDIAINQTGNLKMLQCSWKGA